MHWGQDRSGGPERGCPNLPNQALLIQTLPLLEAQASSEIESIVTTTDELFKHPEITESMDPATKEALQYRAAKANHPPRSLCRPDTRRSPRNPLVRMICASPTAEAVSLLPVTPESFAAANAEADSQLKTDWFADPPHKLPATAAL